MSDLRSVAAALAALAIPMLAAGAAQAQTAQAQDAALIERGEDLLHRNCSMCHAVGAAGASPNAVAPLFREMHRRYPIDNLAEALAEGILTGHPQMPQFTFDPDEVEAIIAYLKSIQTRQGASLPRSGDRPIRNGG